MLFVRGSWPWAGWTIMVWAGKLPKVSVSISRAIIAGKRASVGGVMVRRGHMDTYLEKCRYAN